MVKGRRNFPLKLRNDAELEERRQYAREVGARVAAVRNATGTPVSDPMSQSQMVKLIGASSQPTYARWETGGNLADVFTMLRFAARMRVTLDYIYRGSLTGLPAELIENLLSQARDKPEIKLLGSTSGTDWHKDIAQALRKSSKDH